ncbi:MAG: hypothetical protein EBZ49_13120, partial [Proteobacteria bacterium]|nr:hypothetical protein [Pseudomonadota bacterium]
QLKTEIECMDRWLYLRNNTEDGTIKQIKGNWTPEEDMILKKKVAEHGLKKWKEIATFLPGRIGKQCRERWITAVDPSINKSSWSLQEEHLLLVLWLTKGSKWREIATLIEGGGQGGKFQGKLEVHGVIHPIAGTYQLNGPDLEAEFTCKLSDFKIPEANYMGVGVEDEVKVVVKLRIP